MASPRSGGRGPAGPLEVAATAVGVLAIPIGAASWFLPNVDGADLWWHLAAGRFVSEHHAVPLLDPFSHTAQGQPWTNHSWLWGWLFWIAYDVHPDLAAWLNLGLLVGLFSLVAWSAWRTSRSWLAAGAATWLAAATCHWFLDVRPHVATLLLTAWLLATLGWRRAPWSWPPLFALWANLHAGFAFGLGLLGLHVGLRTAQALRRGLPLPRSEWAGLACAALAVGLNPWGLAIYGVPFQPLDQGTPFRSLIEWRALAPSLDPRTYAGRFGWMALFSLLGAARNRQPLPLALALATGVMSVAARRFVPLFAVCAAPLAARGFASALGLARRALPGTAPGGLHLAASGSALLAAVSLWQDVRWLPRPLQRWTAREAFPTAAAAYLAGMRDPPRRLFNFYDWGGFLLLAAPGVPIFIDGRAGTVYDDAVAGAYLTLVDARRGWRRELEAYGIDAVLVPPDARLLTALQSADPPWRVAHADPRSVLLFPPDARERAALPAVATLLEGSDLGLTRGFRWRRRGDLERAGAELLAAQRLDPMNLFVYGELMSLAAARGDAPDLQHWIDEALRVYPQRVNQIWAFAETAWGALGRCDARLDALRRLRLDEPFVSERVRELARERIRRLEALLASGSGPGCGIASGGSGGSTGGGALDRPGPP
jgi:hypothetical protein